MINKNKDEPAIECIVCACNKYTISNIEYFVCGVRHYDKIMISIIKTLPHYDEDDFLKYVPVEQGFITNHGRFVDRKEGLSIALKANQINYRTIKSGTITPYEINENDLLFSEDLY